MCCVLDPHLNTKAVVAAPFTKIGHTQLKATRVNVSAAFKRAFFTCYLQKAKQSQFYTFEPTTRSKYGCLCLLVEPKDANSHIEITINRVSSRFAAAATR